MLLQYFILKMEQSLKLSVNMGVYNNKTLDMKFEGNI